MLLIPLFHRLGSGILEYSIELRQSRANRWLDMNKNIFWIAPIIVMVIGILPMPYGYYSISRLVECGSAIFFSHRLHRKRETVFAWLFGGLAILYNPIFPIHLYDKELWMAVNALTAVFFFIKRGALNDAV